MDISEYMNEHDQKVKEMMPKIEITDYDMIDIKKGTGYLGWKHCNRMDQIRDEIREERDQEEALIKEECQYLKVLEEYQKYADSLPKTEESDIGSEDLDNFKAFVDGR